MRTLKDIFQCGKCVIWTENSFAKQKRDASSLVYYDMACFASQKTDCSCRVGWNLIMEWWYPIQSFKSCGRTGASKWKAPINFKIWVWGLRLELKYKWSPNWTIPGWKKRSDCCNLFEWIENPRAHPINLPHYQTCAQWNHRYQSLSFWSSNWSENIDIRIIPSVFLWRTSKVFRVSCVSYYHPF